ncbi:hypothetical protein TNCT_704891 [Trichonephila clavata]|uniref:Uncharacterized protein n=1 Tax=Trichonephila clavata TaxID=2740835 RepID=A0A8X6HX53_TRICU|nr:hypothetical protein TNCT_704891 [Trichonephila clavata]
MASQPDFSDMEQSPTTPLQRSLYEQQAYAKTQLERMQRIKKHKLAIVEDLKSYPDHENDHSYQNAMDELQNIENSLTIAVSDFDSVPVCTTPGFPFQDLAPAKTSNFYPKKLACSFS